ncbi:MAG TPA: hypothetical protein VMT28_01215 [Terriglobales bacterium]|jgi:hypothetical protein|nr:hypothetical protein [Terriglobales bacterium]
MRKPVSLCVALFLLSAPGLCCSKQRGDIKQLKDAGADRINFTAKEVSVDWLASQARPEQVGAPGGASERVSPLETQVYRVRVKILKADEEHDGDYKLLVSAINDSTQVMVVEVPEADCVATQHQGALRDVRHALDEAKNAGRLAATPIATLEGVGYWGFVKPGQTAANGIELHPVLKLEFEAASTVK